MKISSDDLIIPVYLNQRNVFDLLAMLEGGLSTVTRINTIKEHQGETNAKVSSSFGLSNALSSLLKVDLNASASQNNKKSDQQTETTDRYHTPASMLQILRKKMKSQKLLISLNEKEKSTQIGDIVEFSASIKKNPLSATLEKMIGAMDMSMLFSDKDSKQKKITQQDKLIKSQMEEFLKVHTESLTVDMITDELNFGYRTVITIEKEFLNDQTMSDLIDGDFKVIGKIIRLIDDEDEAIDLQRKSSISLLSGEMLKAGFSGMNDKAIQGGINFPEFESEIKGPVLHILPIAIFT